MEEALDLSSDRLLNNNNNNVSALVEVLRKVLSSVHGYAQDKVV